MSTLLSTSLLLLLLWPAYLALTKFSSRYTLNRWLFLLAILATAALPLSRLAYPMPVISHSVHTTIDRADAAISSTWVSEARPPVPGEVVKQSSGSPELSTQPTDTVSGLSFPDLQDVYLYVSAAFLLLLLIRLISQLTLHLRSRPKFDYRELAAGTGPGDPYYEYYLEQFPEPLESFEIYTDRMLTGDEYLRVRALVSRAEGSKVYIYRESGHVGQ